MCLVLAPTGRDAIIAGALLRDSDIESVVCADIKTLHQQLSDEVDMVLMADEALRGAELAPIAAWVRDQASWSDLPFIVLAQRDRPPQQESRLARITDALGNVTFLERPFHPGTFSSVVVAAVKARRRQYDSRAYIEELRHGAERLQHLNETLEKRVAERTEALESAHKVVLQEIEHRQRTERRLRQAQKLEMIGQLTGGVAHDFNNLLMVVLGNLGLLRKRIPADGKTAHLIEGAIESAQRGAALTQRLLAFARRQDLMVEPRDIAEVVKGMSELLRSSISPGIELRMEIPENLPPARVDSIQVELALLNLVVNARDAMPQGGTLRVSLDATDAAAAGELAAGRYVRICISDSGTGMDAETLAKATEPFFTTKEVGRGTGLGLSMVHGLARQLSGELRLYSEVGRGTRAELWLPACEGNGRPAPGGSDAGEVREPTAALRVLVVDDDAMVASSTAAMLEDLGHHVVQAGSAARALEIIREDAELDIVVTDFLMPKMTGVQLAREARRLRPDLPVLLVTGYAELSVAAESALPRLHKPYQQHELEAQIKRLLS